jgi:hypothetical protein
MAMKKFETPHVVWQTPARPDRLPDASTMRVVYGSFADELVIRFPEGRHVETVVVPNATPGIDYGGLLVEDSSGSVIGVHVMPLVDFAVGLHPSWMQVTAQQPEPAVVNALVEDIKGLFERFGIYPEDSGD